MKARLRRIPATVSYTFALSATSFRLTSLQVNQVPKGSKVTARMMGAVKRLLVRKGKPPVLPTLCLPPGAGKPSRCT